jgi:hypothetical protein
VAAFHPTFVMLPHDMAVRAGGGIVGHVGTALRVPKRVQSDSKKSPAQDADNDCAGDSFSTSSAGIQAGPLWSSMLSEAEAISL